MRRALVFVCLLLCWVSLRTIHAQTTIFVTRHADRYGTEPDPSLTPTGEEQARALGRLLADANVRHIFTTELVRTQQTAAPLARLAGIAPVAVPQKNFDELIANVRASLAPDTAILVVGHRATVPKIVHALSGKDIVPLGSGEYGRLIAITLFPDGRSSLVTLRYAATTSQ
jgi:broad specificity phosphatase PhoE